MSKRRRSHPVCPFCRALEARLRDLDRWQIQIANELRILKALKARHFAGDTYEGSLWLETCSGLDGKCCSEKGHDGECVELPF
jgi:hypothetical protein